ncbi:alpha/beta knot [Venturia nashicola]|uniref:rRNA methyltransferase 1, mitochondrial n=1 Tax=Venturia nashicola TaxID=86259 RepID=A0A4Z1NPM5_9PEZI|nr:alpha/beta knot [Venturia nashicola]
MGSVLLYSPAKSTSIVQIQRRFISRNTAIHRGLRQEASGGRTERPWEDRNKPWESRNKPWESRNKPWESRNKQPWERRGKQSDLEPSLTLDVQYPKRWEDRSNQRQLNDGRSSNRSPYETKHAFEKRLFQSGKADLRNPRSYGDGQNKWEKKPYQQDRVDRGSIQSYEHGERTGQSRSFPNRPWEETGPRTRKFEPMPWQHRGSRPRKQQYQKKAWEAGEPELREERRYPRETDDRDQSRSYRSNNRGAPSTANDSEANDSEAAPLGFTRPTVGRDQGYERQPQPRPMSRKEYKETKYEAESEPISIPYTTAASEFLYGYNPVRAALKAGRRKLYKIYIHRRAADREGGNHVQTLEALAENAKVEVKEVDDNWLRVMDKMTDHRPHNGVVLEASPLPRLPVVSLGPVQKREDGEEGFHLNLGPQSTEELVINGDGSWQSFKSHNWRSPFVLLIDDVTNPGNLGAIIRSAHFLGVDAIALSTRTCAPLNADAVKASAGAAEAIPIFKVENVSEFLQRCTLDHGISWDVYAATTPRKPDGFDNRKRHSSQQGALFFTSRPFNIHVKHAIDNKYARAFRSPLGLGRPVILAIGGEQKGLGRAITQRAMAFVQVLPPQERLLDVDVDSLNVSAASAILCAQFMTKQSKD